MVSAKDQELARTTQRPGSMNRNSWAEAPDGLLEPGPRSARDVPDTDTTPPAPVFRADLIAELKSAVSVLAGLTIASDGRQVDERPGLDAGLVVSGGARPERGCRHCGRRARPGRSENRRVVRPVFRIRPSGQGNRSRTPSSPESKAAMMPPWVNTIARPPSGHAFAGGRPGNASARWNTSGQRLAHRRSQRSSEP